MRLVKAVIGEFLQLRPKGLRHFARGAADFDRTLDELRLNLFHQVDFFLTDGFTQRISLAASKAAPFLRNLHKLLLVDQNSVGVFQRITHTLVQVGNRLFAVLAADKAIDKLHRPRTVQRHHSDDILKMRRLERPQVAFHTRRF